MFKKTIPLTVAVSLALFAGAAAADQTFHPSKDETGTIMHVTSGLKSRAQVNVEQAAYAKDEVSVDGWRYVGGETGWELVQHAYTFRAGKLVHVDNIDHNTPKPTLASVKEGRKQYQALYSGG